MSPPSPGGGTMKGGGVGKTIMDQEQERLLDELSATVKEQAAHMKRAIDNDCIREALKFASNMLCELRTPLLSPKNYYDLYMQVFHELQHITAFFSDKRRHGRKISELYESVQHAGNIIPRLYLLVTVGSCYIQSKEAPGAVKAILTDMTELCKGVQHPMRGLFLRYYLTQMCKDKLPDTGSEYESEEGGNITDAFEFLFLNFTEAARLWVRLQYQGAARDRHKRENERHDLRVLVGANLVRMAQLEGMTTEFYAEVAAPRILKQITSFKDVLAQQYLLDCVVQVFSDECHLQTLSLLLASFLNTQPNVDPKPILLNLMNRLSEFATQNPEQFPESIDIFGRFHDHILQLFQRFIDNDMPPPPSRSSQQTRGGLKGAKARSESPDDESGHAEPSATSTPEKNQPSSPLTLSSLLEVSVSFLNFTLIIYPNRIDYVDRILCAAVNLLGSVYPDQRNGSSRAASRPALLDGPPAAIDSVIDLLASPLRTLSLDILRMDHYSQLMKFLTFRAKRKVASAMVTAVLSAGNTLDDHEATSRFFAFISPLLKDADGRNIGEGELKDSEMDSYSADQQQVARLLHLIHHVDTDQEFAMINAARTSVASGVSARAVGPLLSGLVFCALRLIPRVVTRELAAAAAQSTAAGRESMELYDGIAEDLGAMRLSEVGDASTDVTDANADLKETSKQSSVEGLPDKKPVPPTTPPTSHAQKIFHFIHRICLEIAPLHPEMALNLFLNGAIVANDAEIAHPGPFEPIAYEFLTQALVCFEEELSDSKGQIRAINMLIATVCSYITCLEADNYDNIAAKIAQHSARLLRKADSCRAVLLCSNLFWQNIVRRNETRVLECLRKCLKIADVALTSSNTHVVLFVEILEKYTSYFQQGLPGISQQSIFDLVSLCAEHLSFDDMTNSSTDARRHFRNIVGHIWQKDHRDSDPKFRGIKIETAKGVDVFLSNPGVDEEGDGATRHKADILD